ncbi:hypothetical protein RJT34_14622 [Clitoria ternatea]|uniref:Uncharacterized protein n=1 Tax=Clitoria ternatea TaxID=43366 RepID=A0AAN9PMU0_CLITE
MLEVRLTAYDLRLTAYDLRLTTALKVHVSMDESDVRPDQVYILLRLVGYYNSPDYPFSSIRLSVMQLLALC